MTSAEKQMVKQSPFPSKAEPDTCICVFCLSFLLTMSYLLYLVLHGLTFSDPWSYIAITIATCVFEIKLNHKQASSALFFSLTRIKVGFLARGLRQKVLESSHGDGFFSRISTRKFWSSMKWLNLKLNRFHCDNWVWDSNDPSIPQKKKREDTSQS